VQGLCPKLISIIISLLPALADGERGGEQQQQKRKARIDYPTEAEF
jgi:hypothetical protein